jgi:hypothetical protein
MHTESPSLAQLDERVERPVDPWAVLAGGSVGIVAGFGVDLFRLGLHEVRQALAARSRSQRVGTCRWQCPGTCDAGAR